MDKDQYHRAVFSTETWQTIEKIANILFYFSRADPFVKVRRTTYEVGLGCRRHGVVRESERDCGARVMLGASEPSACFPIRLLFFLHLLPAFTLKLLLTPNPQPLPQGCMAHEAVLEAMMRVFSPTPATLLDLPPYADLVVVLLKVSISALRNCRTQIVPLRFPKPPASGLEHVASPCLTLGARRFVQATSQTNPHL